MWFEEIYGPQTLPLHPPESRLWNISFHCSEMAAFRRFKYTWHRKGLYFDGHDHVDVVEYHQNVFLPAMKGYEQWLVHYVIGDVDQEVILPCNNYVECCLVLLPQDKMTSQANDIVEMMWVYKMSIVCRRRGLVMVFIRVKLFVRQLDG